MDVTLRHAKITNRTVADECFAVTANVETLYDTVAALRPAPPAPRWPACTARCTNETAEGWLTPDLWGREPSLEGYRPTVVDSRFRDRDEPVPAGLSRW